MEMKQTASVTVRCMILLKVLRYISEAYRSEMKPNASVTVFCFIIKNNLISMLAASMLEIKHS